MPHPHIEFVSLGADRALVVPSRPTATSKTASSPRPPARPRLDARSRELPERAAEGRTLADLRGTVAVTLPRGVAKSTNWRANLSNPVLAVWENRGEQGERLIVRGQSNLLFETAQAEDIDRIRSLFDDLERKRDLAEFLDLTEGGEGCASSSARKTSSSP